MYRTSASRPSEMAFNNYARLKRSLDLTPVVSTEEAVCTATKKINYFPKIT
jgi:hypothetical protein